MIVNKHCVVIKIEEFTDVYELNIKSLKGINVYD